MREFSQESADYLVLESFCRSLLDADWEDANSPLRLSQDLAPADLIPSIFLQNTRTLLTELAESEGTAATATGNLNRVFVRRMFDRMSLAQPTRESLLSVCKVMNETDVWALHIVRIVNEIAGLVCRRKKQFQITRLGRELLTDSAAGLLFRKLFITYFQKFDLQYDFPWRKVPGIQQTMAVILWRVGVVARDWVSVHGLAPQILMPNVLTQIHKAMAYPGDKEGWILSGYVLEPLFEFGLIERQKSGEWPGINEDDVIRVTPPWRKFISFTHPGIVFNN
jgi:hypothetical protein